MSVYGAAPDPSRSISCPLPWCDGALINHGGLGDDPTDWVHSDGLGLEVLEGWWVSRSQLGAGEARWELAHEGNPIAAAETRAGLTEQLLAVIDAIGRSPLWPGADTLWN